MGFGGLYNVVFGDGHELDRARILLGVVGGFSSVDELGRYRDCWVEAHDGVPLVAVYTRNGGGNRDHHCDELPAGTGCDCIGCIATYRLPAHRAYLRDADDDYDSTYATFYFRVPREAREPLMQIAIPPVDMAEQWRQALGALENASLDEIAQMAQRMGQYVKVIGAGEPG